MNYYEEGVTMRKILMLGQGSEKDPGFDTQPLDTWIDEFMPYASKIHYDE